MSVERRILKSGKSVWRVRWRERGQNRSRQFDRKGDALSWEAETVDAASWATCT